MDYTMVQKGNLAKINLKSSNISETGESTPTKIGVLIGDVGTTLTSTCMNFFEPILFESQNC